jgi:hypothetical protein
VGPPNPIFNENWNPFSGVNYESRKIGNSSPFNVEVETEWIYTSAPPTCLHAMDRENFTFTESVITETVNIFSKTTILYEGV